MPALTVVSVVARDLVASVAFYRGLGLELAPGESSESHATFAGSGVRLMLDTEDLIRELDPHWTRPEGGHAIALAFECATPGEVDETFARLVQAGAGERKSPWDAFWGQRYATVVDPDGNAVDLFCNL